MPMAGDMFGMPPLSVSAPSLLLALGPPPLSLPLQVLGAVSLRVWLIAGYLTLLHIAVMVRGEGRRARRMPGGWLHIAVMVMRGELSGAYEGSHGQ